MNDRYIYIKGKTMTKTAKEIVAEEAARKKALTEKLKAERLAAIEARPVLYKMSIDIFSEEDMIALKQILLDLGFKPHTRSQEITRKPRTHRDGKRRKRHLARTGKEGEPQVAHP
jgi:hypothetical protein